MLRIEIIANQSVHDEIIDALEEYIPNILYTVIPLAEGRGQGSYKLGTSSWPETNFVLFSYVKKSELEKVKAIIKAIKEKFPDEGIKAFLTKAKDLEKI
ncbi:MAG: hypothetical protein HDR36_04530 [Treponema sp.]|nr:hypothetical protein [Treponema sp.]MBD5435768.1 hypothetical protein [Treponema sp.]